jgi:hypothetical protein
MYTQPRRASRICLDHNDRVVLAVIEAQAAGRDNVMLASNWPDEEIAASLERLIAAGRIDAAPKRVARAANA